MEKNAGTLIVIETIMPSTTLNPWVKGGLIGLVIFVRFVPLATLARKTTGLTLSNRTAPSRERSRSIVKPEDEAGLDYSVSLI